MIKKYGVIIILVILIIALSLIVVVYKNNKKLISELKIEQVRIYDENEAILKVLQEEYDRVLAVIEEEKKVPVSTIAAVPIFMYHFVRDDVGNYEYPENMIKINTLREQLKYIKDNGYEPIYVREFNKLHKYSKPVALTFDDGWEDFYINAFPLIKEYNIKATLFVVDKFFTTGGYCNIEQLKELKESGLVDIQSHTMTHPYLSRLSLEKIEYEVVNSKKSLKEKLGIDSIVLSYPYGDNNKNVIAKTKQHYTYGLEMDGGVYYTNKHNPYEIPRIYVNRSMKLNVFISYLMKSSVKIEW